jgi:hypothetical protein
MGALLAYLLTIGMAFAAFWAWIAFAATPGVATFVPALGASFIGWSLFRVALR